MQAAQRLPVPQCRSGRFDFGEVSRSRHSWADEIPCEWSVDRKLLPRDGDDSLPFTAFHPVPVWLLWKRFPARLDFVALTVGAIIPDLLEPLFLIGLIVEEWSHRDWTHSLLGALTFDAVLGVAATVLVARPLLTWADRRWPSGLWSHFAGHDIRGAGSWPVVVASVWVGSLSHALVDLPFHPSFRLLFPAVDAQLFHWTLEPLASLVSNLLFAPLFVYVLYVDWWRPFRLRQRLGS